ncbi:MAG: ribosome maturation factor RimM [Beijerinckiaceae bacterium]|nr:MAG: ribosome maturation factor RimM [Beijerinckiaceae bacterium]
MPKDRILVGQFGAAHGVKGEVRLKSFTQDPAAIGSYKGLADAGGTRRFEIESLRLLKDDLFVARVKGIATRTAAEALTNVGIFIARTALPPADEDEFYHADLIGLTAQTESGEAVGTVSAVLNFGGGDILEIAPPEGGESVLLPFTKEVVPVIDIAAGIVRVALPNEVEAGEEKIVIQD